MSCVTCTDVSPVKNNNHGCEESSDERCGCDAERRRLLIGIVLRSGGVCVRVNVRFVWGAFVGCCFACGCVLELVVCRVRFARVSCPRLRFS